METHLGSDLISDLYDGSDVLLDVVRYRNLLILRKVVL